MTQATPSATLKDVVTAAVAAYGGDADPPKLGREWTPVSLEQIYKKDPMLAKSMTDAGFSGQVSVNLQTGEVIIADRGTQNLKNIFTDAELATREKINAQPVANAFALAGLRVAKEMLAADQISLSAIYTTGHSLGGTESQGQMVMLSGAAMRTKDQGDGLPLVPEGVKLTNVSIDAPGIDGLKVADDGSQYVSYNFSSQGDLVHLSGGKELAGTTDISLPVGPPMMATGGLLVLGAGACAIPGAGPLIGGSLMASGLRNAYEAHSSMLILSSLANTELGDTPMSQLLGAPPSFDPPAVAPRARFRP